MYALKFSSGLGIKISLLVSIFGVFFVVEGIPLFDGGGGTPDDQMLLMLDNQKVQLAHLTTIFQALITQSVPTTQQGTVVMNSFQLLRIILPL